MVITISEQIIFSTAIILIQFYKCKRPPLRCSETGTNNDYKYTMGVDIFPLAFLYINLQNGYVLNISTSQFSTIRQYLRNSSVLGKTERIKYEKKEGNK